MQRGGGGLEKSEVEGLMFRPNTPSHFAGSSHFSVGAIFHHHRNMGASCAQRVHSTPSPGLSRVWFARGCGRPLSREPPLTRYPSQRVRSAETVRVPRLAEMRHINR